MIQNHTTCKVSLLHFKPNLDLVCIEDYIDKIRWLISSFERFNLVFNSAFTCRDNGVIEVRIESFFTWTFEHVRINEDLAKAIDDVVSVSATLPRITVSDSVFIEGKVYEGSYEAFRLNESRALVLFTSAIDANPVVCDLHSKLAIPHFLVSQKSEILELIFRWCKSYRMLDSIWLDSSALEMEAYSELASIDSTLSEDGLQIEKATFLL